MFKLQTNFLGLSFANPFLAGAGALGYGMRQFDWMDPNIWGGISLKGLTLKPQVGHPHPRLCTVSGGLVNAIGLRNPGWDRFLKYYYEQVKPVVKTHLILNLNGNSEAELLTLIRKASACNDFRLFEINLSCPNVSQGGIEFGHCPDRVYQLIKKIRQILTNQKLIVKLSGVLINLKEVAKAAERAGADAISLINSVPAMLIDADQMTPTLSNKVGGLSGSVIKPIALRAVYQVFNVVKIPIIGMGGISSARDAIEFMLAGASMVEIGSALWTNPQLLQQIMTDFRSYCRHKKLSRWQDIIGKAH